MVRVVGAGEAVTEAVLRPAAVRFFRDDQQGSLTGFQCGLDTLDHSLSITLIDLDPVDHRFDVVHLVATDTQRIFSLFEQDFPKVDHFGIHPSADESLALK